MQDARNMVNKLLVGVTSWK